MHSTEHREDKRKTCDNTQMSSHTHAHIDIAEPTKSGIATAAAASELMMSCTGRVVGRGKRGGFEIGTGLIERPPIRIKFTTRTTTTRRAEKPLSASKNQK